MRAHLSIASAIGVLSVALVVLGQSADPARDNDVPLLADGTVNFGRVPGETGVWELSYIENFANVTAEPIVKRGTNPRRRVSGSAAEPHVPFLPWAAALYDYNIKNEAKYDPGGYCRPPGGPRLFTNPYPMLILQVPDQKRVFFLFEAFHVWREVFMDGREHESKKSSGWLGHSVGHYEDGGKTLVIDVRGFNEGTWLDSAGHPHTDQLHVVEKFTRPSRRQLHYEAMIDDPGAYSRPWKVSWNMTWWADGQLDEYVCEENNQYLKSLRDDFGLSVLF